MLVAGRPFEGPLFPEGWKNQEHLFVLSWYAAKGGGLGTKHFGPPGADDRSIEYFCNLMQWSKAASLGSSCYAGWHFGPESALGSHGRGVGWGWGWVGDGCVCR